MRERLFDLIAAEIPDDIPVDRLPDVDAIVERLLAAGVIVPPCKVGDTVYQTDGFRVYESTIKKVIYDTENVAFDEDAIGKSIFLTKEEAEKALAERREE
jgi:hypothetical protein